MMLPFKSMTYTLCLFVHVGVSNWKASQYRGRVGTRAPSQGDAVPALTPHFHSLASYPAPSLDIPEASETSAPDETISMGEARDAYDPTT